jgi:hypothetical protein
MIPCNTCIAATSTLFISWACFNAHIKLKNSSSCELDLFTERVVELQSLSPRIRSKVMDAFRKFGQYYFYKYNNDQCTDLVSKIIRRHSLNVGNTEHGKLYIVDDNYLEEKLKVLLDMKGEIGLIVKMGLYSGLREEELVART